MPETPDSTVKTQLQDAAHDVATRFPGRAFCLFVFPSSKTETAHYVGNAPRKEIMKAVTELTDKGMPGYRPDDLSSN